MGLFCILPVNSTTMEVFQSWADIVIMLVIAIAYIITYIAQRNQIKSLTETSKSHADLSASQSVYVETLKKLFNPSDLEGFISIKVGQAVSEHTKSVTDLKGVVSKTGRELNTMTAICFDAIVFIYATLAFEFKLSKEERTKFVKSHLKDYTSIYLTMFDYIDQTVPESKRNQIRDSMS